MAPDQTRPDQTRPDHTFSSKLTRLLIILLCTSYCLSPFLPSLLLPSPSYTATHSPLPIEPLLSQGVSQGTKESGRRVRSARFPREK